MKIRILKPGLLSTIQDMGRRNYLSDGIPFSGAMDQLSAQIANMVVGNDPGCAVIEFTQSGASFTVKENIVLAWLGDGAYLSSEGSHLPSGRPVFVPAGGEIYLEHNPNGFRSYLAVAGGWDVPEVLGSRSTYIPAGIGGINGRALVEHEQLNGLPALSSLSRQIVEGLAGEGINYPNWQVAASSFLPVDRTTIRVIAGREFEWFDDASKRHIFNAKFTVANNSSRMGYRLRGEKMTRIREDELLSTAVVPGIIQVAGDGEMILLMADAQTTGGYPRIAQVASVDMPLCAQLKPGDDISFCQISLKDAERLYLKQVADLNKAGTGVKQKYS